MSDWGRIHGVIALDDAEFALLPDQAMIRLWWNGHIDSALVLTDQRAIVPDATALRDALE